MTRAEADASLFALLASESDREAKRRMQGLTVALALLPLCAISWAFAIAAIIDLMGVL